MSMVTIVQYVVVLVPIRPKWRRLVLRGYRMHRAVVVVVVPAPEDVPVVLDIYHHHCIVHHL